MRPITGGAKKILLMARSIVGNEVLLESLKRIIERPDYYGNINLDYILAAPGTGLRGYLKNKSYGLVIILDQDDGAPGFYLKSLKGADYGPFVIARLRDKGFIIRSSSSIKITDGIMSAKKTVARYVPRRLSNNMFKLVTSAKDPQEEQIGAHLIALETLLRQSAGNYTSP